MNTRIICLRVMYKAMPYSNEELEETREQWEKYLMDVAE
ncbi:hypothetical protein SOVF_207870 [Spinacia oleracea]|nr:hypothetical protein SOVF_207870 [Spinacia oleracea]